MEVRDGGVGLREVLGSRGFRWLVAVRLTGSFSDGMLQAALATFVLFSPERAATPTKVAISFAVLLLPYSLIGPFAGVLLDRWRRRQVLVGANLVRAFLVIVLATVVARGSEGLDLAFTVLIVLGVNRFVLAALSAGTPHVVAGPHLVTANAIAPTLGTAAAVTGGLVGVAISTGAGGGDRGSVTVLSVAVATYVLAGLTATRLGRDELGPAVEAVQESLASIAAGMVDGVRRLHDRPRAWRAIALVSAQRITFGIALALAVLQVRGALHGPLDTEAALRDLTVTTGFAGAGAFIGAVLTPRAAKHFSPVRWSVGAMVFGVSVAACTASTGALPGLLVMGLFIGFGGQAVKVCSDTVVQAEIDDEHLGRVFSLYDMAVNVAIVTGLTYTVFVAPADGRSVLAAFTMVVIVWLAGALALRADHRDKGPRPIVERSEHQ